MIPVLVSLVVAASAAVAAHQLLGLLARGFAAQRERYGVAGLRDLPEVLLILLPSDRIRLAVVMGGGAALSAWALAGPLCILPAAAIGAWAALAMLRMLAARRLRRLEMQLCEALPQLAAALRAGLSLPQALEAVGRDSAAPLGRELTVCVARLKLGVGLDAALQELVERSRSFELELVAAATAITRQIGGNLAELFESLAGTLQERFRLEGRVRALTAQGRMQGRIVSSMPLLLGLAMAWLRPDLVGPMLRHPFGWILVAAVVTMLLAGLVLIKRIVAIRL